MLERDIFLEGNHIYYQSTDPNIKITELTFRAKMMLILK